MKPQIKHRHTDVVLFEGEAGMTTRQMLEKATTSKANLYGADLYGADLYGANLYGADLYGADLGEEKGKLFGDGYFSVGPVGSRKAQLQAFHTDKGIWIKTGCFYDSIDSFREAVAKTHGDNNYGFEYSGVCTFIEHHFNTQVSK